MNNVPRYSRLRSLRCPRCNRHVRIDPLSSRLEEHNVREDIPCTLSGAQVEDRTGTPIWTFPPSEDWTT